MFYRILFAALLLVLVTAVHAFEVEPMVMQLDTSGRLSKGSYTVRNDSEDLLPVEVHVFKRVLDENGEESLVASEGDFLILPPIGNIKPKSFQTFKVRYLGIEPLSVSTSYRIVFEQLKIKNQETKTGVNVLFNFGTLVFVSPQNVKPQLSTEINDNAIAVSNIGTGVATMHGRSLSVADENNNKQEVQWSEVADLAGAGYLLPGQTAHIPVADWYSLEGRLKVATFN
ncbi:fimbrial biogenesis chaperone [Vibrio comitans]|uniref:Pili assembly chaperone N-terminal domain-containing protein n=1 Tax=Vibrio comitans NBRC 102076 TaxID=1219078 RepID=A0A4Y3IKX6_9VIBR|nr:fimbria/pilus periplasmic chaperone [Vibrio comitans]GEA60036.1 hypothetical protein VCO01S_12290 [Vibrio comitans NBRC 102076]